MLRWVPLLALAACGVGQGALPTEAQDTTPVDRVGTSQAAAFNVLFYNTENLFDTINDPRTNDDEFTPEGEMHWTGDRYRHKLQQLAEAIRFAGKELPGIIGLCEVENKQVVEDLAATPPLASMHYQVVHKDSPDERGIDVALLVAPAIGTAQNAHWLTVDLGDDRTRDVLVADVQLKAGGDLHVFVDHWPSRREGEAKSAPKRMTAALTVRKEVDALLKKDPQTDIVIMGDLNDMPGDASIAEGLRASGSMVEGNRTSDLFDLVAADAQQPVGSITHVGQWQYFDHLIVSRDLLVPRKGGWHTAGAASLKDKRLLFHHPKYGDQPNRTYSGRNDYHTSGYSDHLPVVMELRRP